MVTDEARDALARLGASLFTAERAAERADNFLRRVDHARLAARLTAQREMAVTYQRAKHEAGIIQRQITAVDDVREHGRMLAEAALDLPQLLATPTTLRTAALDAPTTHIAEATTTLDDAITHAAAILSRLCYKLDRTRYRGVHRSGGRYIVPFIDQLGADRARLRDPHRSARRSNHPPNRTQGPKRLHRPFLPRRSRSRRHRRRVTYPGVIRFDGWVWLGGICRRGGDVLVVGRAVVAEC